MKKRIYTIKNKILVDGHEGSLTKNEILVSNNNGSITLKELSPKGKVVTISGGEGNNSNQESEFYYFDLNKVYQANDLIGNLFEGTYCVLHAVQFDESNGPVGVRQRAYFNHAFPPGSGFPVIINYYIQVPKYTCFQGFCIPLFEGLVLDLAVESGSDYLEVLTNPELMEKGKKEIEATLTSCMVTEEVFYNGKKPDFNEMLELFQGM